MDITPHVESLRRDLLAAAEGSGEEVRTAAERLGFALEPSARLALMEAISQACAEITAEMPAGGVDVRLEGRDLGFTIHAPEVAAPPAPEPPSQADDEDEGELARITLRLPEGVKSKAEDAAAAAGQSLNTWLVQVVRAATRSHQAAHIDLDLSSFPFPGGNPFGGRPGPRRMSGWV